MKKLDKILNELKDRLKELYKESYGSLILYGSYARGESTYESDIDFLLVIKGLINPIEEINKTLPIVSDLSLKYDVVISIYPVTKEWLEKRESPLLMNIRKEGRTV